MAISDQMVEELLQTLVADPLNDAEKVFGPSDSVLSELKQSGETPDVDGFVSRVKDKADPDDSRKIDEYLQANSDSAEIVRKLLDENPDDVMAEYQLKLNEAQAAPAGAGQQAPADEAATGGYDPVAWNAFIPECSAVWNSAPSTWEAFRPWLLTAAQPRGLTEPATAFLDGAEGQLDRVAFAATYGFTIVETTATAAPAEPEPAEAPTAAEQGEPAPAAATADSTPADVAKAHADFEEAAREVKEIPPEFEAQVNEAFKELVEQMPEAASLSQAQMRELLTSPELAAALAGAAPEPSAEPGN